MTKNKMALVWDENYVKRKASPGSYAKGQDLVSDESVLTAIKSVGGGATGTVRGSSKFVFLVS